jgi:hypothetical protein
MDGAPHRCTGSGGGEAERLGEMRLETGKYLRLDAALAERIRTTPGHTVLPVSFAVAACGGLGVQSEGVGTWLASGNLGARSVVQMAWARGEKWAGGPGRLGIGVALCQLQLGLGYFVDMGWPSLQFSNIQRFSKFIQMLEV